MLSRLSEGAESILSCVSDICGCIGGVGQERNRGPTNLRVVPQRHDHDVGDHGRARHGDKASSRQDPGIFVLYVAVALSLFRWLVLLGRGGEGAVSSCADRQYYHRAL